MKKNLLRKCNVEARNNLKPLKLRAKAAKFAKDTVKNQMSSFKCSGVWADWNNPYLTVDLEYEATQIESPSSRTTLAEAEFQYPEGHVSRSIYAIFRVASAPLMPSDLVQEFPTLCLAIWTTTPWTIPANAGWFLVTWALRNTC
ncbi:tRNA synthetase class I (I, L, M and V) family protein [Trifolium repens]|nr:tRNA synthetase class I (I, L, M and V) family protein [Trifolium repens]